ncbi:MAG: hypothetical protein ACT4O1_16760 [Gemmatimonadota bacterium]
MMHGHACTGMLALAGALFAAAPAVAQTSDDEIEILRLEATPVGALPPIALPMPASRNHNYWGIRVQAGHRGRRGGDDLEAVAGGIDLQWRGGSVFGVTAGYQKRDCTLIGPDCGGHSLFGARARFNVITGGPTVAAIFGDYSANTTLGTEVGFGYAPRVMPDVNACTIDVGAPLSLAMLQHVRLAAFVTPGVVWELGCSSERAPTRASYLMGLGIGAQQLGHRGLDVYLGFQKIFRSGTGYQLGVSVTYVRLP